jgi:iron complex outermembrane receptor protein
MMTLTLALAWHGSCLAAASEEDLLLSFGEEEFLSIATGQKQLIAKAPAVASVITAEEIAEMGATTLEEVLETVPGVHVSLSSNYLGPVISIRGIYTDKNPQVLMLINGVPITHLYFGNRGSRPSFPVRDIERVEVIRGPGSAVYGADAFAGVINVITRTPGQTPQTEVGARVASFDTTEYWILHSGQIAEKVDVALSLQGMQTDGDDSRRVSSDAQSVFDRALAPIAGALNIPPASLAPDALDTGVDQSLDARIDLRYDRWQLRMAHWRCEDCGPGPGLALALEPNGSATIRDSLVDLSYVDPDFARDTTLELRTSYMDVETKGKHDLFPPGTLLPIGPDGNIGFENAILALFPEGMKGRPGYSEQHYRADAALIYEGLEGHSLRLAAGFSYQEESGEESKNYGPGVLDAANRSCGGFVCLVDGTLTDVSNTPNAFIQEEDRTVFYGSLQDQWQLANDWGLTIGLRYDDYSDFGSTLNPRVALVWDAAKDLTTKFLYGRAFRAPSFAELFVSNNPVGLGNEDLDPEVIDTYEIAFDYRPNFDLRFGINVFYFEIEDLIEFVTTGDGASIASNTGQQRGAGFEIETEWKPIERLSVIANYAYQKGEEGSDDHDAARAPENQAYLRATWRFAPEWSLSSDVNWVSDRNREDGDPRNEIDDYTFANLNIERRNLFGQLDLAFRVRNLFDEDAREPSPYENLPDGSGSLIPGDFRLEERSYHLTAKYRF